MEVPVGKEAHVQMLSVLAEINAQSKQILGHAPLQHNEQQVNYRD